MAFENTQYAAALQGAPNFRDLGGWRAADGRRVRHGRVFRSDSLSALTERDLAVVAELRLRLVCDLRSEVERRAAPNPWLPRYGAQEWHLDINADLRAGRADLRALFKADPTPAGARRMMVQTYRTLPLAFEPLLGEMVRRLAQPHALPAVFHCTAGKDRTGFLAAILLYALGVDRDAIYEDYLASEALGGERVRESSAQAMEAHFGYPVAAEVVDAIAGVEAAYLDHSFAEIAERYGSADGYLETVGLGRPEIERLRDALLE